MTQASTITRHRSDVLHVIENEMRGPLLGLQALLEAMGGHELTSELSHKMRGHSRVLADRLALLAEDLVLISDLGVAEVRLELEELDLSEELAACAAVFPDLVIYADTAQGLRLRGDRVRLRQILTNLFRNAQRRGGRPLWLFAHPRHDVLTIRVPDVGRDDGYELAIVRLLVSAHGGSCGYSATGRILSLSFPLVR
jgi:signal transduction histidine kinase